MELVLALAILPAGVALLISVLTGKPIRLEITHRMPEPAAAPAAQEDKDAQMVQETIEIAEKGARHQLEHLEDELTAKGLSVTKVLTAGPAAGHILEQAAKRKADMIVLGSHGHTALYDLIVGGTTHAVLRKATCPVLIVPRGTSKGGKRKK